MSIDNFLRFSVLDGKKRFAMVPFDFETDYILEDERVVLRPLVTDDVENLLHFSINEPNIWHYSYVRAGGGRANLENYMKIALDARVNILNKDRFTNKSD